MRVLFVNERCGFLGGVEQNVLDTAEGLRRRGHACFLAFGTRTGNADDDYEAGFDRAVACRELAPKGWALVDASSLEDIVRDLCPDVLYVHKIPDLSAVKPFDDVRVVRMVHDHDLCCPRRHKYFALNGRVCSKPAGWRCWADGAFLERAPGSAPGFRFASISTKLREMRRNQTLDALLVGSQFMRDELLMNGFESSRVRIVPPCVRVPDDPPSSVPTSPEMLYVGQLIRGKGVDLLLDAVAKVPSDIRLTIVGTGNARDSLERQAATLGIAERVTFAGWVPNAAIGSFYAAARALVVPSRWPEPFGMIGLEAMYRGRPVIGFAVGGIPDWLENEVTGLLVREADTDGLASAIERVMLDDTLAERLGAAGLARARSRYSFDGFLDEIEVQLGS